MPTKKLTLSLIIPAYNEERHIRETLQSVAAQTVKPDEVIVVDNNSTDTTATIVKEFNFVTLVKERKQGLTYTRNRGFNTASCDILGRIDADSILDDDWVEKTKALFETNQKIDGMAGIGRTPLIPYVKHPIGLFHMKAYFYNVHSYFRTTIMWGGNMAIRRDAWKKVEDLVTNGDEKVHEDQDITLWLTSVGCTVKKAYHIRVTSYDQSFRYLPKMLRYIHKRTKTAKLHRKLGNLPVKNSSLNTREVLGSHVLELPALLYGLVAGIVTLPIDVIALHVFKARHWFD